MKRLVLVLTIMAIAQVANEATEPLLLEPLSPTVLSTTPVTSNHATTPQVSVQNGTYEAIGPHFQGNPYNLKEDVLVKHGTMTVDIKRDFESISQWLNGHPVEGLVFWFNGEPMCKIKRTDFGYEWPVKAR